MKTTILAIILAVSLCTTAYILNRNFHGKVLIDRIERVERDMMVLEDKYDSSNRNARRVIKEVKRIVEEGYAPYDFIIPVSKGYLGIKKGK